MKFRLFILFLILILSHWAESQVLRCGAERTEQYIHLLKGKKVALCVNHTSRIGNTLLVDTLLNVGIQIQALFSPEHGLRGEADAGQEIDNGTDGPTGLPLYSLYGKNKKPSAEQLKGIDCLVFDIQDVGVRFYTYISTLQYVMEACAGNHIPLILLDRPNPNGYYIDGPVLDTSCRSFVGMQPVPVVYGMTIGEYAALLKEEGWLRSKEPCTLTIIPCEGYTHHTRYELPVAPSPNLKSKRAVQLYPSLCFFEGTPVSVGRGTDFPFEMYGHPSIKKGSFTFVPQPKPGATHPPLMGQTCFGQFLHTPTDDEKTGNNKGRLHLEFLLETFQEFPTKDSFFHPFFDQLAGTKMLRKQIQDGKTEEQIRQSWQNDILNFKKKRKKYLLYPDFE